MQKQEYFEVQVQGLENPEGKAKQRADAHRQGRQMPGQPGSQAQIRGRRASLPAEQEPMRRTARRVAHCGLE